MFRASADLSSLEPDVQIFHRSSQLGAPCSDPPQIFWKYVKEANVAAAEALQEEIDTMVEVYA
jgi:hypothetical protein